ncbi:MAG: O-methyltransferase [Actinomycetota bacterium]|nr:O-methyltransferase [Actinomycetota bacterium]
MSDPRWEEVDAYLESVLLAPDPVLDATLADARAAGLPAIDVAPTQGALLQLLASAVRAEAILEVGTLGGYSTIWLARSLPPGGRLVSLEIDPHHAEVARANLARAGLDDRVEVRVGPARAGLGALVDAGEGPFDLAFIDADKPGNPDYFAEALRLVRPGGLIVVDNVVRGGAVAGAGSDDPGVVGSRRVLEAMGSEPRVLATALQTVGAKGYDGLAVALVR